jgi:hypothetical protein
VCGTILEEGLGSPAGLRYMPHTGQRASAGIGLDRACQALKQNRTVLRVHRQRSFAMWSARLPACRVAAAERQRMPSNTALKEQLGGRHQAVVPDPRSGSSSRARTSFCRLSCAGAPGRVIGSVATRPSAS